MRQANICAAIAGLCLVLLAGCTATRLTTEAQLPPPLIERLPARVGVYYSKEFREYVHRETRGTIEYEINLGPAHVTNLDWLLKAMFSEIVPVEDPTKVADIRPPLVMVLEPKFEEYSFLTPKDVAGEAFIVTIRYLLTLYDGSGGRVDSFAFTGYGREKAHTLASKEPLAIATQRAMRDAGAKVAVELADQESVRLLVRNAGAFPVAPSPVQTTPPRAVPSVQTTPAAEAPPVETTPPEESPPVQTTPPVESPPEQSTPPAEAPQPPETPPSGTGGR